MSAVAVIFLGTTGTSGELQGFVTMTTFTTWVRWFRWESCAEIAGLHEEPSDVPPGPRRLDEDGALAKVADPNLLFARAGRNFLVDRQKPLKCFMQPGAALWCGAVAELSGGRTVCMHRGTTRHRVARNFTASPPGKQR